MILQYCKKQLNEEFQIFLTEAQILIINLQGINSSF